MKPIITSLLDTDFYKLTMGQLAFLKHRNVQVRYGFTNRTTSVRIADFVDEKDLRRELDHVRTLRFTDEELEYLRGLTNSKGERIFKENYLEFLSNLQLPDYKLKIVDGTLVLEFSGRWSEAIYWETIALPIINELYYRALTKDYSSKQLAELFDRGMKKLLNKTKVIKENPRIVIIEFGTRRRFSGKWQRKVIEALARNLPASQFPGTSNVKAAMELDIKPIGTFAHEAPMAYSAIYHDTDESIKASHNKVLQDWEELYGKDLTIALTDTFGSEFFFSDITKKQAQNWHGLRHDSGEPLAFGDRAIEFYEIFKIDPTAKMIVFSDGLTLDVIVKIAKYFENRIKFSFGWGTNLTNDLGFKPLSLVIKIIEVNNHATCKLSDNLAKAMGPQEVVERFKKIFGYIGTLNEPLVY